MSAVDPQILLSQATDELVRLLASYREARSGPASSGVRRVSTSPLADQPLPGSTTPSVASSAASVAPTATPVAANPLAASAAPEGSNDEASRQDVVAHLIPGGVSSVKKYVAALVAALAGTGISGATIMEFVRNEIHNPLHVSIAVAVLVGAGVIVFFSLRFAQRHVQSKHVDEVVERKGFLPLELSKAIMSPKVGAMILGVIGMLATGAGGTLLFHKENSPNVPAAPPASFAATPAPAAAPIPAAALTPAETPVLEATPAPQFSLAPTPDQVLALAPPPALSTKPALVPTPAPIPVPAPAPLTLPVSTATPAPTTTPTPAAAPTAYGITIGGVLASVLGFLLLQRNPATPKKAPPDISQSSSAPAQFAQSAPAPAPTSKPSPAPAAAVPEATASSGASPSELPKFQTGNPAAVLLDKETPLREIQLLFGLDGFSCNVLLLAAAADFDARVRQHCAAIQRNTGTPTIGLALALFGVPELAAEIAGAEADATVIPERAQSARVVKLAALAADAPLRAWRLVLTKQPDADAFLEATLRCDPPILSHLCSAPQRDEQLIPFRAPLAADAEGGRIADSQWTLALALSPRLDKGEICILRGSDAVAGQLVAAAAHAIATATAAAAAAAAATTPTATEAATTEAIELPKAPDKDWMQWGFARLDRIVFSALDKDAANLAMTARLWQRESILLRRALYIDAQELSGGEQIAALRQFLHSLQASPATPLALGTAPTCRARLFVSARETMPELGLPQFAATLSKPTLTEQETEWKRALTAPDAARLADEFDFNLPAIERLVGHATAAGPLTYESVRDTCRASRQARFDGLAHLIKPAPGWTTPEAAWDHLVLPPFEKNQLRALADQLLCRGRVYREWKFDQRSNRGFGISALFTGESGTGKTTAAEVIAHYLGLDLYRVDLSAIMDKYIGESEKKMGRLFDAADEGGVCMLFDEADAPFAKRSAVKDSHDRYANVQVDYLLQRMEAFRGFCMLASNRREDLDPAFLRRLRYVIHFSMPDRQRREEIWRQAIPAGLQKNVSFPLLAQATLSGGQIQLIALNAAFLAARDDPPALTMAHLGAAMDAEFLKTGLPARNVTFPGPFNVTTAPPATAEKAA